MRLRRSLVATFAGLGLITWSLLSLAPVSAEATATRKPLVVIVAAGSKLRDISHALLRRIFLGEPTAHQGVRWVPFNYVPDDPLRISFDERAFDMSQEAIGRYWVDRRIRGQGMPPRAVASQTLLRAVVARLPGAIGYITSDQLHQSVRALTVDGVAYDRPNYLLR